MDELRPFSSPPSSVAAAAKKSNYTMINVVGPCGYKVGHGGHTSRKEYKL